MFQGEYEHTLDEKNRVVLPAGIRKGTAERMLEYGFTLVIGRRARYLELHPMQDWTKKIERQRAAYTDDNEEAEEYFRDILSSAFEVFLDKNYRFVIPEARKNEAGIGKDVVIVGMWQRIEIWDKGLWSERKAQRAGRQSIPKVDRPG